MPSGILQALYFYCSSWGYHEEETPQFLYVTDNSDLTMEPMDNGQPITDFEDEKVRKKNEWVAKTKTQPEDLWVSVRALASNSAALLSSFPTFDFCLESPAFLLSYCRSSNCLFLLHSCFGTSTALSSCLLPALVLISLADLMMLLFLNQAHHYLGFTALSSFKQTLSNEFLYPYLTNTLKTPCLFLSLGLLPNKTDRKRIFDIEFINFCLFLGNYAWKKIDLSIQNMFGLLQWS